MAMVPRLPRWLMLGFAGGLAGAVALAVGWLVAASLGVPSEPPPEPDGPAGGADRQVSVWIDWFGGSPEEVQEQITRPVVAALGGLAGVRSVRSWSELGWSRILVTFDKDVDLPATRRRVAERLETVELPPDATPTLPPDAGEPVFWYTLEGDLGKPAGARRVWKTQLEEVVPKLQTVAGVAEVLTVGSMPEVHLRTDPRKLQARGVTLRQVCEALEKSPADRIADVGEIMIGEAGEKPVRVKDVAEVRVGFSAPDGTPEKEAKRPIGGVVRIQREEKPEAVVKRLKDRLEAVRAGLPKEVRLLTVEEPARRREMLPGWLRTPDLEVKVFGPDLATIRKVCRQVGTALRKVRGAGEVRGADPERADADVQIKREEMARHGVEVLDVMHTVVAALFGRVIWMAEHGEGDIPVRVRLGGAGEKDLDALRRLPMPTPTGTVPLGTFIEAKVTQVPLTIQQEDGRLLGSVGVEVRGREPAEFLEEARKAVATVRLPAGVKVEWVRHR